MKTDPEALFKKLSDSRKHLADDIKDRTVGNHIFALIVKDGEISLEALRLSLTREIESSRSARGECDPDFDDTRMDAEAALRHLNKIAPENA